MKQELGSTVCRECRFFHHYPLDQEAMRLISGQCRRRPPSPDGGFPEVKPEDWCGKFRPAAVGWGQPWIRTGNHTWAVAPHPWD